MDTLPPTINTQKTLSKRYSFFAYGKKIRYLLALLLVGQSLEVKNAQELSNKPQQNITLPDINKYPILSPCEPMTISLTGLQDTSGKYCTINPKAVFARILGNPQNYDVNHSVIPEHVMQSLWESKLYKYLAKNPKLSEEFQSQVIPFIQGDVVRHKLSLEEYLGVANSTVYLIRSGINLAPSSIPEDKQNLLYVFLDHLDGKGLVSYGITELCDNGGNFGVEFFRILLENFGVEFLDNIPALHDKEISKGAYQFTFHALHQDSVHAQGANIFNKFLPDELQIPGSVSELEWTDHHIAATLFALFNILHVSHKLTPNQIHYLSTNMACHINDLICYSACAHHNPKNAQKAFLARANNNFDNSYQTYVQHKSIENYAKKTIENLKALENIQFHTP